MAAASVLFPLAAALRGALILIGDEAPVACAANVPYYGRVVHAETSPATRTPGAPPM
jgi:hypothetical protein